MNVGVVSRGGSSGILAWGICVILGWWIHDTALVKRHYNFAARSVNLSVRKQEKCEEDGKSQDGCRVWQTVKGMKNV